MLVVNNREVVNTTVKMCSYFKKSYKNKTSLFNLVTFLTIIELASCVNVKDNLNETFNEFLDEKEHARLLSRRKRFLVFPDGSSLQLVFCCQTAALIPIGDIFLFGNTAALAWNLPTDPKLLSIFKDGNTEGPTKRMDSKTINYVDEDGKIISRVPYTRKAIVNPAFAKRSVGDEKQSYKDKLKIKLDIKKMHERHLKINYLKSSHLNKDSVEFHRNNRKELYEKLEKLITALGRDGRQCVLYKLCETAQRPQQQGTFLQEFLRVVFTLPKGEEFEFDEHKEYDKAHSETDDCLTRYPGCDTESMVE